MITDLILGTAGHIDHGKTSLVKALTGTDTDRLPEEKKRGITIELGFAELPLGNFRLGIVDVPGHERFIRNMLSGATGFDLALLVVAADDSVKPQTREHVEILKLLDLQVGIIAITKCDLPNAEWIDLVEEEVRDLVCGTFLSSAPIVRTSTQTGQGISELKRSLATQAERAVAKRVQRIHAPFRMAIDRSFVMQGHGSVVTGSVSSGTARVGDELSIEPGGLNVRVRGLQNYGRPVDRVQRGQRAAINLAGVHHGQIGRGQELATTDHLAPSKLITVDVHLIEATSRPLKHRQRVRVHLGTAELMASVLLLGQESLESAGRGFAQLVLSEPAVAACGQPFVLRRQSPVETIGGGRVLNPNATRLKMSDNWALEQVARLASDDELTRAAAAIYFLGWNDWHPRDLARLANTVDGDRVTAELIRRGDIVELPIRPNRMMRVHRAVLDRRFRTVEEALTRAHDRNSLEWVINRSQLIAELRGFEAEVAEAVLARMHQLGLLVEAPGGVGLPGRGPQLSSGEQKLLQHILETYRQAGFEPPTAGELQQQVQKNRASVPKLIALAAGQGHLVRLSPDFYLHTDIERHLKELLAPQLAEHGGLTVSQIREILGTTRKYALPICEYLDGIGFTRREGDLRVLATTCIPAAEQVARLHG